MSTVLTRGGQAATPPAPGRPRRSSWRSKLIATAFVTPVVLFLLLFFVSPMIRGFLLSMEDYTARSFVTGEAPFVGFSNYIQVLTDSDFPRVAWHTVLFTVVSLAGQFSIGMALALFFARRFPLATTLRSLLLLPWLLPLIVSATSWRWMLDQQFGVINKLLGSEIGWLTSPQLSLWSVVIVNIWLGIPFNMVLLYGGIKAIPESLYEAAAIDGASRTRVFWSVTWPMLRPVTAVTLMLGLVYTIKVFDVIWILTKGGPANSSHTIATWAYDISFSDLEFGVGAAAGQLLILVALVFGLIYLRNVRKESKE
jgi:multiple sugar transport system permease protein